MPIKEFYNNITGNESDFYSEKKLHPQILHYPSGGGFFARHFHSLEPQKIGLIVSLSEIGKDFNSGGTGFEIDNESVSIEEYHRCGDIALFRFDLPHWVSPVDITEKIEETSVKGRWTLVMPYY